MIAQCLLDRVNGVLLRSSGQAVLKTGHCSEVWSCWPLSEGVSNAAQLTKQVTMCHSLNVQRCSKVQVA